MTDHADLPPYSAEAPTGASLPQNGSAHAPKYRAYGSDRVTVTPDGVIQISSRLDKGWTARTAKTALAPEHPGTAVEWDGEWFEVTIVEALPREGVRYSLTSWKANHVFRVVERYDETSERARAVLRESARRVQSRRKLAILLAPLSGQLPASVQKSMNEEYGTPRVALTLISAATMLLVGLACMGLKLEELVKKTPPRLPASVIAMGFFVLAESMVRLNSAARLMQPMGSIFGQAAYSLWYLVPPDKTRLVPPPLRYKSASARRRLASPSGQEIDARQQIEDRYAVLEPFLALLRPDEQIALQAAFGFDPILWGGRTAVALAGLAVVGTVSSLFGVAKDAAVLPSTFSLLVAVTLLLEQIARMKKLRSAPAGSLLGALVRPFAKALLDAARRERSPE